MNVLIEPACEYFSLYSQTVSGLHQGAAQQRKKIKICQNLLEFKKTNDSNIAIIVSTNIDWTKNAAAELRKDGYKMILVGAAFEALGEDFSGPTLNRSKMVGKLLNYFISAGRTRLASVGNLTHAINDQTRVQAFLSIGKALGLCVSIHDVYDADQGLGLCIERFLDKAGRYDGAICVNDMVAIELLAQAKQRGIMIPDQLFVAGSGDFHMGRAVTPSLTTTTLDYFQMGVLATDIWQLMQKYKNSDRIQISLPCELIIRQSTDDYQPAINLEDLNVQTHTPRLKTDNAASFLRNLENCLMTCDPLDMNILSGIYSNESIASMAGRLFVSVGTVNYRLKQLYALTGEGQKTALMQQLQKYITDETALEKMALACSESKNNPVYDYKTYPLNPK